MLFLEMRTLIILTMLANFMFAAVILTVRHMAPGDESIRRWSQGAIASGLGNLLITLRGVIPDLFSVVLANVLFAWGYANLYLGSRYFLGKSPGPRLELLFGGLIFLSFIPLTYWFPSMETRIFVISLVFGCISLLHAYLMLSAQEKHLRGLTRFIGWVLLFAGIIMLLRGIFTPLTSESASFFESQDWIKSSAFLVSLIVSMCLGATFPIMIIARIQHTLGDSEMRARAMLQALPDMMFRVGSDGTLLDYKAEKQSLAVFANQFVINGNFLDFLPHDFALLLKQKITEALVNQSLVTLEYEGTGYASTSYFFEIRIASCGHDEVTMIVREITERKRNEAEIQAHRNHLEELVEERTSQLEAAKNAAEAANVAKGAFLANISHEMRTPMHQMGGLISLIKRESLSPKQTDHLSKLGFTTQRMSRLIETVLEVTKIEANKFEMTEAPIVIDQLLNNLVATLNEQASSKGLQLLTENQVSQSEVIGDQQHIRLALFNYVENAIRFTESGSVRVIVSTVEDGDDTSLLKFSVEDTGIGISAEIIPQLFQLFQQADNSMTRKFGGTGAGLYITKRIAQLMGGDAGCTSQLGQGSIFWFTIRLKIRSH